MIPAAFILLPFIVLDAIVIAMLAAFVHDLRVRGVRHH